MSYEILIYDVYALDVFIGRFEATSTEEAIQFAADGLGPIYAGEPDGCTAGYTAFESTY